jgi:hypothetical protein
LLHLRVAGHAFTGAIQDTADMNRRVAPPGLTRLVESECGAVAVG